MSTTTQAIVQIREDRAKREAEKQRWTRYRIEANPPMWFVVLAMIASLAGMIAFAGYLLGHPNAIRSPFGLLIAPGVAILYFGAWLSQRREKALIRAIREEAPALFEKLKAERLIR
jgi:hypothetical protein